MYVVCIFTCRRGGIHIGCNGSGKLVGLVVACSRWWCGVEGDHPLSSGGTLATTENDFALIRDCASNLGEEDIVACIA